MRARVLWIKGTCIKGNSTLTPTTLTSQLIFDLGTIDIKEDLTSLDTEAAGYGFDYTIDYSSSEIEVAAKTAFLTAKNIDDVTYNFPTPAKITDVVYSQENQCYYIVSGVYEYTLSYFLANFTAVN